MCDPWSDCFPRVARGDWHGVLHYYRWAREDLRTTDPREIQRLTADHTTFAKTMDWLQWLVRDKLEQTEPSPDTIVATPEAALDWMLNVDTYLIFLALFEAHETYMVMLDRGLAHACCDSERWLTYAHKLNDATRTLHLNFKALSDLWHRCHDSIKDLCDAGKMDALGPTMVRFWGELIPLSEKIALFGDEVHALYETIKNIKRSDLPRDWHLKLVEIYLQIDSLTGSD